MPHRAEERQEGRGANDGDDRPVRPCRGTFTRLPLQGFGCPLLRLLIPGFAQGLQREAS
jgi:hypothetical protein